MARYVKKRAVVQAERVFTLVAAALTDWGMLPAWVRDAYEQGTLIFLPEGIDVKTLGGPIRAAKEDWIVRSSNGEITPWRAEMFAEAFDPEF